jgi:DNA-binding transcriptional ArsR family regulator
MTIPHAERVLETLGDPTTRAVLRRLLVDDATQDQVKEVVGCDQSTASRALRVLREVGLVEERRKGRTRLSYVAAREELLALLLAADRLAERLLERASEAQTEQSAETRRLAVRPAKPEAGHA